MCASLKLNCGCQSWWRHVYIIMYTCVYTRIHYYVYVCIYTYTCTSGSISVEGGAEAAIATWINAIMITEYLKTALRLKQVELQIAFSAN